MSALTWDGWETSPEEDVEVGGGEPVLANWHYLRSALRRERRLFLAVALTGLLLALGALVVVPAGHRATTLLVLAHDPLVDPARAMETDLTLATTRAVAQRTIDELALDTTPEKLLSRVEVSSRSSDTALLSLTASSDAEAVRELTIYLDAYVAIRTEQARAQADALTQGSQQRIEQLRAEADQLTTKIDEVAATGDLGSALLGDLVGQRSQLIAQSGSLEQTLQDAQLRAAAVVSASRVVDPPRAEPPSTVRRVLLLLVTGLIGGAGLGVAVVLGRALTSTRLRRRDEIGLALGVPVTVSVGRLDGGPAWARPGRLLRRLVRRDPRAHDEMERRRLARAIEHQFPARGWRQRLRGGQPRQHRRCRPRRRPAGRGPSATGSRRAPGRHERARGARRRRRPAGRSGPRAGSRGPRQRRRRRAAGGVAALGRAVAERGTPRYRRSPPTSTSLSCRSPRRGTRC